MVANELSASCVAKELNISTHTILYYQKLLGIEYDYTKTKTYDNKVRTWLCGLKFSWNSHKIKKDKYLLSVWKNANIIYDAWKTDTNMGRVKLYKYIDSLKIFEYHIPNYYKTLLRKFRNGWIPIDDNDWVLFSKTL